MNSNITILKLRVHATIHSFSSFSFLPIILAMYLRYIIYVIRYNRNEALLFLTRFDSPIRQ